MRVTFVLFDFCNSGKEKDYQGSFHHGVASLSAFLKHYGHVVSLIHVTNRSKEDTLVSDVLDTAPDIVGFSITTHSFPHLQKWAPVISKALKQDKSHALVICGGVHVTLDPNEVISTPGIDAVCIGEVNFHLGICCTE